MSEIKQVWGIIKDYQCADLNMVLEPAVAVWKHQQAKVDEIEHQKSLQELAINQISQANQEWQRINAELQKQIDELQKRVDEALKFVDGSYTPNTQLMWSIGKRLRGEL